MKKAAVFGGSRGLGFAIVSLIRNSYDEIDIFDIREPLQIFHNVKFHYLDVSKEFSFKQKELSEFEVVIITAGIGVVNKFEQISLQDDEKMIAVNVLAVSKIVKSFYGFLQNKSDRYCFIMGSIAGMVSSPLCSTYGATKSYLVSLCESLNIELEKSYSNNRITCGIATSFKGSSFNGGETNVEKLKPIAEKCIEAMYNKNTFVFLDDKCKEVIERYNKDKHSFGISSYEYKVENRRIMEKKITKIGYLSGTFDLFHIGHLNLIRRAKEKCDYLIVGVHRSGSWKGKETFTPFDERVEILKSLKYVDEVHEAYDEDSDAWLKFHFDMLFVGSDYKGSDRFNRYESFFKDKNVEIVYFPYTTGTNSTQIRQLITRELKNN